MANFTGTLNSNIFYTSLFNGFKYMRTEADALAGLSDVLVSKYAIEGGDFGDKLVYTDMDLLKSRVWDPTDTNVLATEQKVVPVQQEVVINKKRQIPLTVDNGYLSKRVWMAEGSWEGFKSVVNAQVANTKKLYDQRMVNTAVGTMNAAMPSSKGAKQSQKVVIAALSSSATYAETEAYQRIKAMKIGKKIADIFTDLADSTRDFNDYGFMKAFNKSEMTVIWNKDYVNEIDLISLPTIFNKEGIVDFTGVQLPGRYFGTEITATNYSSYSASTPVAGKPINSSTGAYTPGTANANGTLRALEEMDITVSTTVTHVFPGDELPSGAVVYSSSAMVIPCYIEDSKIICKIVHDSAIVYPTSWKVNTEFYNAKNLSSNHYETWYFGKPDHLSSYPLITLKESAS